MGSECHENAQEIALPKKAFWSEQNCDAHCTVVVVISARSPEHPQKTINRAIPSMHSLLARAATTHHAFPLPGNTNNDVHAEFAILLSSI